MIVAAGDTWEAGIHKGWKGEKTAAGTNAIMAMYSSALLMALVVGMPFWLFRMATSGRYRAGLGERLGRFPARLREQMRGQTVIWMHAVSVGEVLAATELIREMRRARPDAIVALSTTTSTGQALARSRFPDLPVFYLPLDLGFAMRRVLTVVQPTVVVLLESELWPRLLWECTRRGMPIVVVNARLSDRSFRRAMRFRFAWGRVLQLVTRFLAQGEETAERLHRLGVFPERTVVTGNLKFDVRPPAETAMVEQLRRRLPEAVPVLVCGSTLDGEEAMLLDAWPNVLRSLPSAVLILAPRHPQRFAAVIRMVGEHSMPLVLATELSADTRPLQPGSVVLLDTIGDLAAVYSLGTAALVGGSLVEAGGHNPLEPARFGVPVTMGESSYNFREIVEAMRARDGMRTIKGGDLAESLTDLLRSADDVVAMGKRGQAVFDASAGATQRTLRELLSVLDGQPVRVRPR